MVASMVKTSEFSNEERRGVYRAIYERRDIRSHFLPDPISDEVLARLLNAAHHGPSVGFMQPWDFIIIRDEATRRAVQECFVQANRTAAHQYAHERRATYETLKLAAIVETPLNICITCDRARSLGSGLGRQTDPATDLYSTACAVQNLWLAARAESIGVGWVSILDFNRLRVILGIPAEVVPLAYLCVGYVSSFPSTPELESAGWEKRENLARLIHFDHWDVQSTERASRLLDADS